MSDFALIAAVSILTAGLSVAFGAIGPAIGEGRAAAAALAAIAQQPDSASTLSRTLFVSLAMIESTAIYLFCSGDDCPVCQSVLGSGNAGGPVGGRLNHVC